MKVKEIYEKLNTLYPFDLSDRYISAYGGFDNSGIILDTGNHVTKIVWALDFSNGALNFAKQNNAQLLITHHPAVYKPINRFGYCNALGANFLSAVKSDISIISMHLNLDAAKDGINAHLAQILSPSSEIINKIENGGYGSLCKFSKTSLKQVVKTLENSTESTVRAYGDFQKQVSCAAVFAGAGVEESALNLGADIIIGSEIKHHILLGALDLGIFVIDIAHYAAENYSFKKIYQNTQNALATPSFYYEDKRFLQKRSL